MAGLPPLPDLAGAEAAVVTALQEAHERLAAQRDSAVAWGLLGMRLDVHGYPQEAEPCYRRAAALDDSDFRWPYFLAILLAGAGSPEATARFERAAALRPRYAPLEVRRGDFAAESGDLEAAEAAYRAALDSQPGLVQARLGLARAALAAGEPDRALEEARRAVEAAPRSADARGLLADLQRRQGDAEESARQRAMLALLSTARSQPDRLADPVYATLLAEGVSSFWYRQRGRAHLEAGRPDDAIGQFRLALEGSPRAELHDDLGYALQRAGRPAEAIAEHRRALELAPGSAGTLNLLAEAYAGSGQIESAIALARRATELAPDLAPAWLNLGTFHLRAGRRGRAVDAFRRGLAAAPDDPRLAARLAWLLATSPEDGLRDGETAVELARRASTATGDALPEALDVLAAALAEAGRFREAADTAERARQLAIRGGRGDFAGQIGERLELYRAGTPYRERAATQRPGD